MRAAAAGLLALALALPAAAQSPDCPVLTLNGPVANPELAGYISGFADPAWQVDAAAAAGPAAGRFRVMDTPIPDFGYTSSKIWLRICVHNAAASVSEWRVYAHENFFQVYEVYVARGSGAIETRLSLQQDSPFAARTLAEPELVAPVELDPGEHAQLLVSYWSGGSSQIDFSIETKDSYDRLSAASTAKHFFFYGMMILLMGVALVALAVFRHQVFLAYCAYAASALLFVMHEDGAAFQYLWPDLPGFNSNATIFVGTALILSGAIYARVFLRTAARHPRTDKVLLAIILATLIMDIALYASNPQLLKKLLIMTSLGSFLTFTAAGLISYFSGHREVRFYLLAWLGVVLSSLLMNMRHVLGLEIPQGTVHDSMRVVMVLDALMMGLAIADRYNQLRRSRQSALEANLTAAQQHLQMSRRLSELQARHELAVELSKSRDKQIQNVVHDLRQPLHALRLNVHNMNRSGGAAAQPGAKMEAAFTYLEELIAEHLEAGPEPVAEMLAAQTPGGLELQTILKAVEEMFAPDAEAKGLSLKRVASRHEVPVNALVLTRILANLVSNAIKYTESGGILVGTRRRGDTLRIEVHDTGPGMTEAEFARASRRNVRLEKGRDKAAGKGLGLAIAMGLARRNGMRLELSPLRRTGTGLALVIPV